MSTATVVKIGEHELEVGGRYLGELRDANELLDDMPMLRMRMVEDGYLLLRGLQKRSNIETARRMILENMTKSDQLSEGHPLMDAVAKPGAKGVILGGAKALTHTPEFLSVVDSPEIMGFFGRFFNEPALTFDYKWLRTVVPGDNTGAHYDVVYMGRGSERLYTCWTPLSDVNLEQGPLAILVGSHNLPSFKKIRDTYGRMDVDRDKVQGTFSNNPVEMCARFGGRWATTEFQMGDVLIFGMFTMHCSINNQTNRFRISCDTRYQPAADSIDERWMGKKPIMHSANNSPGKRPKSMVEARIEWGV